MALLMVVFWGLLAWAVVALVRSAGRGSSSRSAADPDDPGPILDERLARGVIQIDEYEARTSALAARSRT